MKTTVKPDARRQGMYSVRDLENYPAELPALVKETEAKLPTCPFCGKNNTRIIYGYRPHGQIARYVFYVLCSCGIRTIDEFIEDDTLERLRRWSGVLFFCSILRF